VVEGGTPGCVPQRYTLITHKGNIMLDIMKIKNMSTEEMRNLLNKLTKEIKFREEVGEEIWYRRQKMGHKSCIPMFEDYEEPVVSI